MTWAHTDTGSKKLIFDPASFDETVRTWDEMERRIYTKEDIMRTDFFLENVFSYLIRDYFNFHHINAINKKEKLVIEKTTKILDNFKDYYNAPVKKLCAEVGSINEDNIACILLGVSNALFSEGITWERIIAYFVFVGELAITCIKRNLPESTVDVMFESFSRLVKDKIESWVDDHGGWEECAKTPMYEEKQKSPETSKSSWVRILLYKIMKMVYSQF